MGLLLGGAILTETIFGWPGIGRYIYDAIAYRDYPVIQSGILVVAMIFVTINLIVDRGKRLWEIHNRKDAHAIDRSDR